MLCTHYDAASSTFWNVTYKSSLSIKLDTNVIVILGLISLQLKETHLKTPGGKKGNTLGYLNGKSMVSVFRYTDYIQGMKLCHQSTLSCSLNTSALSSSVLVSLSSGSQGLYLISKKKAPLF